MHHLASLFALRTRPEQLCVQPDPLHLCLSPRVEQNSVLAAPESRLLNFGLVVFDCASHLSEKVTGYCHILDLRFLFSLRLVAFLLISGQLWEFSLRHYVFALFRRLNRSVFHRAHLSVQVGFARRLRLFQLEPLCNCKLARLHGLLLNDPIVSKVEVELFACECLSEHLNNLLIVRPLLKL